MPYKNKTPYFGIPIPAKGDKIQSAEEEKAMNIIENQLLAGMKGVRCCVFEEGYFKLLDNHDGTYGVALAKNGAFYALCGVVGGAYVESKEPILWDGLEVGVKYYLYVQFTESLFEDETSFRVVSTISKKIDNNGIYLLLASVDLSGENKTIDSYPDGKVYSNDIAAHSGDTTNPHGEHLIQDLLTIRKNISIIINKDEALKSSTIIIDDSRNGYASLESKNELIIKDKRSILCLSDEKNTELTTENKSLIGAINELNSNKYFYIDVATGGNKGVLVTIPNANEILFVHYNQIKSEEENVDVGNISIGYWLKDDSIPNKSSFKMYNDGSIGIQMRLQVIYK